MTLPEPAIESPQSAPAHRVHQPWLSAGAARGLAGFIGGFCLLNLLGEMRSSGFDANIWWIDLRDLPGWAQRVLPSVGGVALVAYAVLPRMGGWLRPIVAASTTALLLAALGNVLGFYRLLAAGTIAAGFPVPLSLFISLALALILAVQIRFPRACLTARTALVGIAVFGLCLPLFPVAQMFCFGRTDYRRPADVAVVLGARAYADGRPSDALADRVRTGCELHQAGLVSRLIFSGGPGDGGFHETQVMRTMALSLGVPKDAILLDPAGLNTQATVDNTAAMLEQLNAGHVLVVSHFYHLPRIRMAYQRTGREVHTVPARESYTLTKMPVFMLREVAALWAYYARPLLG